MTNKEWIKSLDDVKTPEAALRIILDNDVYLCDPYYKTLGNALVKMAERVLACTSKST